MDLTGDLLRLVADEERARGLPPGSSMVSSRALSGGVSTSSASLRLGSGGAPEGPIPSEGGRKRPRTRKQITKEAALFTRRAADISRGIATCAKRLERLATIAKSRALFNDPTEEINKLAASIKHDITAVRCKLDDLQLYFMHNRNAVGSGSKTAATHSSKIVEAMQSKLMNTTKDFKNVLEKRQGAMKAQRDRRGRFGQQLPSKYLFYFFTFLLLSQH